MPEITGRLRTPRLAAAPASPVVGEMYFDTALAKLYWWNGTVWVPATGAAEVYEQPAAPASPGVGAIWIDTDDVAPTWTTGIPFVTTLPTNPVDGQEVYYQVDATAGIIWHLRYRAASASAYKWEFVGGPPLTAQTDADEGSLGLSGLIHSVPALTIPRAGDYLLGFENSLNAQPNQALGLQIQWGNWLHDGTANLTPNDEFYANYFFVTANGNPAYRQQLVLIPTLKTGLAASTVLRLHAAVVNWDYLSMSRIITALPVRVS